MLFRILVFTITLGVGVSGSAAASGDSYPVFYGTMVEMTWPEVKAAGERKSVVLLPVSVVEEHGPHMDLGPDIFISVAHARLIRDALIGEGVATVIAPPYYWGINQATKDFPGSFAFSPQLFRQMLMEIAQNLQRWGFEEIYIVNAHGDPEHTKNIDSAATEIRATLGAFCYTLDGLPMVNKARSHPFRKLPWPDYHAGANETRLVRDLFPAAVRLGEVGSLPRQNSFLDPLGYVGDPARLDEGNGAEEFEDGARRNAARIIAFRNSRLRSSPQP